MEGFILFLGVLMIVSIIQYFRSERRRLWFGIGTLSSVLIFLFSGEVPRPENPAPAPAAVATAASVAVTSSSDAPAAQAERPIPPDQAAFQSVVDTARDAYDAATNDLAKGGERPRRGQAICAALPSPEITNWIGTVYELSTNNDGRGVLSVQVPGDIWLSTWSIALGDGGYNTLIDPESPLFAALSALSEGQRVIFSGTLFKDSAGVDCYQEQSMLMDSAMYQPEFVFRFTDVRPAP